MCQTASVGWLIFLTAAALLSDLQKKKKKLQVGHQRMKCMLKPLFTVTPQPVLWQEKLWKPKRDALRPCNHWQVRVTSLFFQSQTAAATRPFALLGFQWLHGSECGLELILCAPFVVRVCDHAQVGWLGTRWLALWGFGNCLRVVKGSSFICHCSHCEEHFMPRELLALNPEICHKMLFC